MRRHFWLIFGIVALVVNGALCIAYGPSFWGVLGIGSSSFVIGAEVEQRRIYGLLKRLSGAKK